MPGMSNVRNLTLKVIDGLNVINNQTETTALSLMFGKPTALGTRGTEQWHILLASGHQAC